MALTISNRLFGLTEALIRTSDREAGSLRVTGPHFDANLKAFWPYPSELTWLRQVHGDRIVTVDQPGDSQGAEADGAFTTQIGVTLAVTTADCAPVVLASSNGRSHALAVVHAGWRGLLAGIVEKGAAMVGDAVPDGSRYAFCGPCIGPDHYEFSEGDVQPLADRYGTSVVAATTGGAPALDLFAGVAQALDRSGFPIPDRPPSTAWPAYYSHRTGGRERREGRMMTLAQLIKV